MLFLHFLIYIFRMKFEMLFLLQGPSHGTTLSITVDDLGSYGCYPDCSQMMGMPLSAAKTVRLFKIKTKHKNNTKVDKIDNWKQEGS